MEVKTYKEAKAKRKAIAKAKRIKEMKLKPRYSIDIWHKLRAEKINLLNLRKEGNLNKIIDSEKLIHSLEIQYII